MSTKLYWADGPWPGRLALASRPRGGDWLEDEIAEWRRQGVDTVASLLTVEEEKDLGLSAEERHVRAQGMRFVSFPIPDREVPDSDAKVAAALEKLDADLSSGKNVVVHCRQGIGRSWTDGSRTAHHERLEPGSSNQEPHCRPRHFGSRNRSPNSLDRSLCHNFGRYK